MILNLAVFFAYHVFCPQGFTERFDGLSALIGLCALLALFCYKAGVIPGIAACGMTGLLFTFLKPWLLQVGVLL